MPTLQRITIPLLKNGNLLKGTRCGDIFIVVRDTCAFDSLTQILINAIVTNTAFPDITTIKNNEFCNFAKSILLINKNITSNIYEQRTKILKDIPIFQCTPYRQNIMHLNTNCNVSHLAEYLFADFPSLTISKKCNHCSHENVRNISVISINIDIILKNGLSKLQDAVLDTNKVRELTCKKCNEFIIENYDFRSHLLIDATVFTDKKYASLIGIDRKDVPLDSILKTLQFHEQKYIIAGVVSYHPYATEPNNGYYTAYIYDTMYWYVYDDMTSKRRTASEKEIIEPHLLMYVFTDNK